MAALMAGGKAVKREQRSETTAVERMVYLLVVRWAAVKVYCSVGTMVFQMVKMLVMKTAVSSAVMTAGPLVVS